MPRPDYQQTDDGVDARTSTRMSQLVEVAVKEAMAKHEVKVKEHLDSRFDELKSIMLSAFPDGDPIGHKIYHQKQIDYMNEKIALWKDIRSKSIIGVLWAVLGFVGMATLEYLKREIQK